MEQYFDETKGDLKYILEEQRRKEMNGIEPANLNPKRKNRFSAFLKWVKQLFGVKKLKQEITNDRALICYILCFITS